jgi:hypothetical protein
VDLRIAPASIDQALPHRSRASGAAFHPRGTQPSDCVVGIGEVHPYVENDTQSHYRGFNLKILKIFRKILSNRREKA